MSSPFRIYSDDSGSDPQSKIFVLGGLASTARRWRQFEREWAFSLQKDNLLYFKMTEAMSLREQFSRYRGWNAARRNLKLLELIGIIGAHVAYGAHVSLHQDDYRKHLRSIPLPARNLSTDHPFMFLFTQFVLMLCNHQARYSGTQLFEFIFDEQLGLDREAILTWPWLKQFANQKRIGMYLQAPPVFKDEKTAIPLQAADLFAWVHRDYLTRNSVVVMPWRPIFDEVFRIPTVRVAYTSTHLAQMHRELFDMSATLAQANPDLELLSAGKSARRKSGKLKRSKGA